MTMHVLFRLCILVVLVMLILGELKIWFVSFVSHGREEEFV